LALKGCGRGLLGIVFNSIFDSSFGSGLDSGFDSGLGFGGCDITGTARAAENHWSSGDFASAFLRAILARSRALAAARGSFI